jgi:AraC family transcriptional regulator
VSSVDRERGGPGTVEFAPVRGTSDPVVAHLALALRADDEAGSPGGLLFAESVATALAAHLLSRYAHSASSPPVRGGLAPSDLGPAIDFIRSNLGLGLRLADIAGAVGISPFHFSRLFKRSTGLSPYQFVLRERVGEAQRLLARGDCTIGEAALCVGFGSQSHLARHVRRHLGVQPRALMPSGRGQPGEEQEQP